MYMCCIFSGLPRTYFFPLTWSLPVEAHPSCSMRSGSVVGVVIACSYGDGYPRKWYDAYCSPLTRCRLLKVISLSSALDLDKDFWSLSEFRLELATVPHLLEGCLDLVSLYTLPWHWPVIFGPPCGQTAFVIARYSMFSIGNKEIESILL